MLRVYLIFLICRCDIQNIVFADYCVDVCPIIKTKTNTFAEAMLQNYKAVARNVCTW